MVMQCRANKARRFLPLLYIVIAFMPCSLWAATSLSLHLKSTQVEHGRYLQAELRGLNLGRDLSQIDLSPLTPLFGVRLIETATETEGELSPNTWQRMLLRLYPRQTGKLSIPPLRLDDLATAASSVTVNPAFSKDMPITIRTRVSASQVWQRQQITIEAELKTAQRFVTLQTDDLARPDTDALTLPITQETVQEGESQSSVFHIQWIVYPQVSGNLALELPPLNYASGGLVEREFHLPIISFDVKNLPPYIPPTIPVGKVTLQTQLPQKTLYTTDKTATWEISLQSAELLAQWLPPVLRHIQSTDSIEFQTAASQRSQQPNNQGPHGQVIHRIPFTLKSTGVFTLPALRIQYFDPDSGRLVTVKSTVLTAYAISPFWMFILGVAFIIVFSVLTHKVARVLTHYRNRRHKRNHAIQLTTSANNPAELRQALKHYALAFGWPENTCLRDWLSDWQRATPGEKRLPELVQRLSEGYYGRQELQDFSKLRDRIVGVLKELRAPLFPCIKGGVN